MKTGITQSKTVTPYRPKNANPFRGYEGSPPEEADYDIKSFGKGPVRPTKVGTAEKTVAQALDRLVGTITDAEDAVSLLDDRIRPVLTPAPQENAVPGKLDTPEGADLPSICALSDSIGRQCDRLARVLQAVRELTVRVEL